MLAEWFRLTRRNTTRVDTELKPAAVLTKETQDASSFAKEE